MQYNPTEHTPIHLVPESSKIKHKTLANIRTRTDVTEYFKYFFYL